MWSIACLLKWAVFTFWLKRVNKINQQITSCAVLCCGGWFGPIFNCASLPFSFAGEVDIIHWITFLLCRGGGASNLSPNIKCEAPQTDCYPGFTKVNNFTSWQSTLHSPQFWSINFPKFWFPLINSPQFWSISTWEQIDITQVCPQKLTGCEDGEGGWAEILYFFLFFLREHILLCVMCEKDVWKRPHILLLVLYLKFDHHPGWVLQKGCSGGSEGDYWISLKTFSSFLIIMSLSLSFCTQAMLGLTAGRRNLEPMDRARGCSN